MTSDTDTRDTVTRDYVPLPTNLIVSKRTMEWLQRLSTETGRPIDDLCENAVEEAALEAAKSRGWLK